jgi:hypothetical protein
MPRAKYCSTTDLDVEQLNSENESRAAGDDAASSTRTVAESGLSRWRRAMVSERAHERLGRREAS